MPLHLIVTRHAKSDWHGGARTDHERPLNDRGLREAPLLAKALIAGGYIPTLILSSDSRRTEETALLLATHFDEPAIRYFHSLYLGEIHDIENAVLQAAKDHETVLVLGHNPGFSVAASEFSQHTVELKTANAVVLESNEKDWESAFRAGEFVFRGLFEGR